MNQLVILSCFLVYCSCASLNDIVEYHGSHKVQNDDDCHERKWIEIQTCNGESLEETVRSNRLGHFMNKQECKCGSSEKYDCEIEVPKVII